MRPGGIRLRLGLFTSITALALMGFSGVAIDHIIGQRIFENARDQAGALLESLSLSCAMAMATNSVERLDDDLAELVKVSRGQVPIVEVAFFDHEGRRVAYSSHRPAGALPSDGLHEIDAKFTAESTRADKPLWRRDTTPQGVSTLQVSMPAVSGLRWGTLIGAFDLSVVLGEIRMARWLLIGVACVLTVLLTFVLYLVLSTMVIRPVRVLAEAVASIQRGYLGARADVKSADELGALATGFNAMAEELQGYTERLERKVEERSREIQQKNRLLEDVNAKLGDAVTELEELARTDPLTGLYNRRHVSDVLSFEIRRGARTEHRLMLAMIDVDHFKRVNDQYGHTVGDAVLVQLAGVLRHNLRGTDIVARYGGEEFLILLLDTEFEAGLQAAEKVRRLVEMTAFDAPNIERALQITVSIGLASFPTDGQEGATLIDSADRALYAAKRRGRNQVVVHGTNLRSDAS